MIDLDRAREAMDRAQSSDDVDAIIAALVEDLEDDPEAWAAYLFPTYVTHGFAPHHHELWQWVWAIEDGEPADPYVAIWGRGGAKSSTAEMAVAAVGARKRRRYVLYIGGTQEQADDHVSNIGAMLESERFGDLYPDVSRPRVGKFGNPRGWRRTRLSTASGFTIDAVGLDTAMRGVRIDADRPDLLVIDDADDATDSPKVTLRKLDRLTRSVLPTGAEHYTVLAVQNLVLPTGVFARIAGLVPEQTERPLARATVSGPIPAIRNLQLAQDEEGAWVIVGGEPTWEGQGLERAQAQIADWTKTTFLIEAQHEVQLRSGGWFRAWEWMAEHRTPVRWPAGPGYARIRMFDTAATEFTGTNDPDYTAGVLLALNVTTGRYCVEDVVRFRHAGGLTKTTARAVVLGDIERYGVEGVMFGVEEEPGPHGRDWAQEWADEVFAGANFVRIPAYGTKEQRAEGGASAMENGLVDIVDTAFVPEFLSELEAFGLGGHDDQCLAAEARVLTPDGLRPIASVRPGMRVLGRSGWVTVLAAGPTGIARVMRRWGLRATASHPVLTSEGWAPFAEIGHDDKLLVWDAQSQGAAISVTSSEGSARSTTHAGSVTAIPSSSWVRSEELSELRASSSTGSSSGAIPTHRTSPTSATTSQAASGSSRESRRSTRKSGKWRTDRSQMASTSTTSTGTGTTTAPRISPASPNAPMLPSTLSSGRGLGAVPSISPISTRSALWLPRGTARPRAVPGIVNTVDGHSVRSDRERHIARRATPMTRPTPTSIRRLVGAHAEPAMPRSSVAAEPNEQPIVVYNLTTTDGTFFAEGILVHNCDAYAHAYAWLRRHGAIDAGSSTELMRAMPPLRRRR